MGANRERDEIRTPDAGEVQLGRPPLAVKLVLPETVDVARQSMVGGSQYPLGRVLRDPRVRQRLPTDIWQRVDQFTGIYNEAKHTMSHAKDTHLFSVEDAVLAYILARKLAATFYPTARLHTDLAIFSQPCPESTG